MSDNSEVEALIHTNRHAAWVRLNHVFTNYLKWIVLRRLPWVPLLEKHF